jgi:hypothetical protein
MQRTSVNRSAKLILLIIFVLWNLGAASAKAVSLIPAVGKNNKFGFINQKGKVMIPFRFLQVKPFHEGAACVAVLSNNRTVKWGYINLKGKWMIPPTFNLARSFQEGLAAAGYQRLPQYHPGFRGIFPLTQANWGYINHKGKFIIKPQFKKVSSFSEGLAAACITKGCGYINHHGKWVIPPLYLSSFPFHEGAARVFTGKFGFINKQGKWVIKPKYDDAGNFTNHRALTSNFKKNKGDYGYLNLSGKPAVPFKFKAAYPFSEGLAFVVEKMDKKTELGYINTSGKMMIRLPQNTIFKYHPWENNFITFSNGLALAGIRKKKEIKYGYINHKGNWVIPPKFSGADPFCRGTAEVKIGKTWGYIINEKGKIIWSP